MKKGFTMIELIFVIVILGILAAVAIPKLAATRDDAKIAKGATEVAQLISDFGAFYTAQGNFDLTATGVEQMTNVKTNGTDPSAFSYTNGAGTPQDCLDFNVSTTDGNLTVAPATPADTAVCRGIIAATADLQATHQFGGSSVSW